MAKRYSYRSIKTKESYSPREIAQLFNIDTKTVRRWIEGGLKVIAEDTNPLLVMGSELKDFIAKMQQKRKVSLSETEFYCVKCQDSRIAKDGSIQIIKTGKTIGKCKADQFLRIGTCKICGTRLNRFLRVCQKD